MDKIYYQPNHLWKGQKAVKKLKELSREKPKAVKRWLSRQAFWQVHLPAPKRVDRPHYQVTTPKQLDGAFGGAYRCYRIDGIEGMDVDTFFARSRKFLIDLLSRETINRAVRSQATTWIRFIKDEVEHVELTFNSGMLAVYNLNDMDEIVSAMI